MNIEPKYLAIFKHGSQLIPHIALNCDGHFVNFHGFEQYIRVFEGSTDLLEWQYDHERKSFSPPRISEYIKKSDIYAILRTIYTVLDDNIFNITVSTAKDDCKHHAQAMLDPQMPVPPLQRTVYAAILASLSDHYKVDRLTSSGQEYFDLRTKRAATRQHNTFIPDLSQLVEPSPLVLRSYERVD